MQNSLNSFMGEFAVASTQLPEPGVVLQCTDDGYEVSGENKVMNWIIQILIVSKVLCFSNDK